MRDNRDRYCAPKRNVRLPYSPKEIPSRSFLRGGCLQHSVGSLRSMGSPVAISFFGITSSESSADLCVFGNGRRPLRDNLFRGRSGSRTRMAVSCGGIVRKGSRADWAGAIDLDWRLAYLNSDFVRDERSDLVGTILDLLVRLVARV